MLSHQFAIARTQPSLFYAAKSRAIVTVGQCTWVIACLERW